MVLLSWVDMEFLLSDSDQVQKIQAHAPNEITWKQDLVTCAAVYAALPTVYVEGLAE